MNRLTLLQNLLSRFSMISLNARLALNAETSYEQKNILIYIQYEV